MTLGVLYDPWPARRVGPLRRYRTMVEFKANPRDEAYMRRLFAERYPEGTLGTADDVGAAKRIVLLFPDAIGVGWTHVERRVTELGGGIVEVRVLNGRRRDFVLDRRTHRRLRLRRLLETTLGAEVIATVLFVVMTPPLLAWDLVQGRR
jgi:hypothetical protein